MYSCLYKSLIQEANAIISTAKKLKNVEVENTINEMMKCHERKSKIIFSGVGKSGIVGRKIAATFSSLGLTSIYLNPLDAFHGDLGMVSPRDICFLISNSGKTKELTNLIPFLKDREVYIVALVGDPESIIAENSNSILDASVDKEICPLNLAPTASTAVAMSIGDALAVSWMERGGITDIDFAINHPAGILGKKLTLKVSDLMIPISKIKPLNINSSLLEILNIITLDGLGFAWVEDIKTKGKITGIITDGDLRRTLRKYSLEKWENLKAMDFMTISPLTISLKTLATDALKKMESNPKKRISVLPVTEMEGNNEIVRGFINLHNIVETGIKSE